MPVSCSADVLEESATLPSHSLVHSDLNVRTLTSGLPISLADLEQSGGLSESITSSNSYTRPLG